MLLAAIFLVIDVWRLRRWAFPFVVIGMNSIAAYILWQLFSSAFRRAAVTLVGGLKLHVGAAWQPSLEAAAAFGLLWLLLFWMHRTRTFVKI